MTRETRSVFLASRGLLPVRAVALARRIRGLSHAHQYGQLQTAVYPREVVKEALRHGAAAVILVHNHPSGHLEPSVADEQITERLRQALELVEVRVLDHVIVSTEGYTSLAELGKV